MARSESGMNGNSFPEWGIGTQSYQMKRIYLSISITHSNAIKTHDDNNTRLKFWRGIWQAENPES